jgi:hypothetical protein
MNGKVGKLILYSTVHCKENPIYVFLFWELRGLSPNFHIPVSVSDLYISRNWETEHYNSVLEITVSFLGIHKWEPDIGFSPALRLQCSKCLIRGTAGLAKYSSEKSAWFLRQLSGFEFRHL